jgi:hypothetical protein
MDRQLGLVLEVDNSYKRISIPLTYAEQVKLNKEKNVLQWSKPIHLL